jgi:hypothetical protein
VAALILGAAGGGFEIAPLGYASPEVVCTAAERHWESLSGETIKIQRTKIF